MRCTPGRGMSNDLDILCRPPACCGHNIHIVFVGDVKPRLLREATRMKQANTFADRSSAICRKSWLLPGVYCHLETAAGYKTTSEQV
jgi:hypothetical protein